MSGYVIMPGDTLSGLAMRNGTSVGALLQLNPQIADPNLIFAGATLRLPSEAATPSPAQVAAALKQGQAANAACEAAHEEVAGVRGCPVARNVKNPAHQDMAESSEAEVLSPDYPAATDKALEAQIAKATGGMTVSEVQADYFEKTGKVLEQETLKVLFNDPYKAREMLMEDLALNVELRNILNRNVPQTEKDIDLSKWEKLDPDKSAFHDPDNKVKYVSIPDGHREAVFNKSDQSIDDSSIYGGTFNFFGPDEWNAHILADVDPWWETADGKEWDKLHTKWYSVSVYGLKGASGVSRSANWSGEKIEAGSEWTKDKAKAGVKAFGSTAQQGWEVMNFWAN